MNDDAFVEKLKSFDCDIFVSMSFDQIFKNNIINLPRAKTINCHAGKLPFYRGRNVLNWVLINDEKEFGITVHFVNEEVDKGDIILQRTFPISDDDDYASLLELSHKECAKILYDAVCLFLEGEVKATRQSDDHSVGFYCSQRKPGDELLDWNETSRDIFNFVRAICHPGPKAKSFINGKALYINRAQLIKDAPEYKGIVGAVLNKDPSGFCVKTGDSFIKIIDYSYDGTVRVGDRFDVR